MDTELEESPGIGIALRIEAALREQGVPYDQVKKTMAQACGVNEQAVYKWFDGKTKNPVGASVSRICMKYGLDPLWISLGEEAGAAKGKKKRVSTLRLRALQKKRMLQRTRKRPTTLVQAVAHS